MMKCSGTDGTSRIMNEKATPFGGWLVSAFVLGSEKAFEVRLRGLSFPPIGDWYFPNIVELLVRFMPDL